MNIKQHEPLRVPDRWKDQERSFVLQIDRILDNIYAILGTLEEKVKALEEAAEENVEEEE